MPKPSSVFPLQHFTHQYQGNLLCKSPFLKVKVSPRAKIKLFLQSILEICKTVNVTVWRLHTSVVCGAIKFTESGKPTI